MANRYTREYKGRRPGVVPLGVTMSREAANLLAEMASTTKSYGSFLTELVCAEYARREERRRMRAQLDSVLAESEQ